ncbi:nucleotide exchange factor GrpE [Pelagibacterales bacterium SAG-MED17]|nr:nucleotide exchange factor GrpE [Pelagibacterales bacterium SAG-MED17]
MDKEELKEKIDKNTPGEDELNTQTTDNDITDQKSEDKDLDPEKKEDEKQTPEQELETLKDKLARTFAEMENQRRRFEKEREDAYEYGGYSFAKEALNLLDNLERSKVALENDEKLKDSDALKKIVEHLDIINNDMLSIFKKNNIEPIKSINEKLDPNLHQAMMEVEDETKEPGTIVQEIQKGFMMKDRLLRPSLVGVSKKKAKEVQEEGQKDEKNQ